MKPITARLFLFASLCWLMAGTLMAANRYVAPPLVDRVAGFDYSGYSPVYNTI